jgi:zinc protease
MSEANVTRFVLENGLVVLVQEDHSFPRVAYEVRVRGGSCDDTPWAGSGLAHLMEHMLFKGTTRRPVGSIEEEVRRYEGAMNAFTSYDHTGYTLQTGSAYLSEALDLLADVLFHSSFDAEEFTREQEVIRSEMKMNRDDPDRRLFLRLWGTAYQVHPYRHPVIGYEEVFRRLKRDDAVAFYRERYVPNNMVLSIVGDVRSAEVHTLIQERFGAVSRGVPFDWSRAQEPQQLTHRSTTETFAVQQAQIMMGFHSTALQHEDLYALDVAAQILGQGRSARFEQRLRRQEQLVHSIGAWNATPQDQGLFMISATVDEDKIAATREAIQRELQLIRWQGVTEKEVERAKHMAETSHLFGLQSLDGRASDLATNELLVGDYAFSKHYVEGVRGVTATAVQRAVSQYLADKPHTFVALLPQTTQTPEVDAIISSEQLTWDQQTLSNGIDVVLGRKSSTPLIALRAVWPGGVRAEAADEAGLANLTAQLLLAGTKHHSAEELAELVENRGGRMSAFSGKDTFGINLDLRAEDVKFGLGLLKELMRDATFPQVEVDREKMRVLAQLRAREDDIFEVTGDRMRAALLGEHPYARHALGHADVVERVLTADCARFYRRYVVSQGMVLGIVGDIDLPKTMSMVQQVLGHVSSADPADIDMHQPVPLTARQELIVSLPERQQVIVVFGYPGVPWLSTDRYAVEVMQAVLSGSGGRLYQSIREEQGLAYTLGAYHVPGEVGGYFVSYVATTPDAVDRVVNALYVQMESLRTTALTDQEVELAKRSMLSRYYGGIEEVGSIALQAALNVQYDLGIEELMAYPTKLAAITPLDVQRVANIYLNPEASVQVIAGPSQVAAAAEPVEVP